ncbi:hypothetical protein [Acidovorax sp. CF316]|uniref:hypothetical protein n=1 Tax=Acidovorax sp. CF316 TaxID=1144317 RepID=UPI0011B24916|nr:hypothetical protein [Acidovorax sp. CF316]
MQLPDVDALPESVAIDELAVLFSSALAATAAETERLAVLRELASKQWHTYERPSAETSAQVTSYVTQTWDPADLHSTESMLWIIGHMGLSDAMLFMMNKSLASTTSPVVQWTICEASQEFGPMPLDPYNDMPMKNEQQ